MKALSSTIRRRTLSLCEKSMLCPLNRLGVERFPRELPGPLGQRPRSAARLQRGRARSVALQGPCKHALQNPRQPKHIEYQIVDPILRCDRCAPSPPAVIGDDVRLAGNLERRRVNSCKAAKFAG